MKYGVKYDPKAEKQLDKLPRDLAKRIVKKIGQVGETGSGIESIEHEPYGYRIRVGDYRVLVDLTFNPDTIWIRVIDHRGRIYKRL